MEKVIFSILIDTGLYNEFTVFQVSERAKSLTNVIETKDANQVLWSLLSLEEYGETTVNNLKQIAQKMVAYTTAVPAQEYSNQIKVEQPPVEQPPVEQPPVEQPPVEQPPVEQPQSEDLPPPGEFNEVQQNIG